MSNILNKNDNGGQPHARPVYHSNELSIQNYQICLAYWILIVPHINRDIILELDLFKGKDAAAEIHARRISRSSVTPFCWRLWEWVTSSNFLIWLLTHLAILHLMVWLVFVWLWARHMMTPSAQRSDIEQLPIAADSLDSFMTIAFVSHYVLQMWLWIVNVHTSKWSHAGLNRGPYG